MLLEQEDEAEVVPEATWNYVQLPGTLLSSHLMRPIRWQWKNHLAIGMISMLDGDPENGKSTLVADMTARITTGRPWPDGQPSLHGSVILVGSEDSIEQVLKPRMVAAGADVSKVLCITEIDDSDGSRRLPSLPEDVPMFEAAIGHMDAVLIVFDPVMPYISHGLNSNVDKDVRQALTPLAAMLDRSKCTGLLLRHLTKDDKVSNSLYRGLGSIAFNGLARTGIVVGKDKEAGDFVFMVHMNNVGLKPKARRYAIEGLELPGNIETSRIVWGDESDHQANELLTAFGKVEKANETAEQLLTRLLALGEVESESILAAMAEAGVSRSTAFRVKEKLGIRARKEGFNPSRWLWRLPLNQTPEESHDEDSHNSDQSRQSEFKTPKGSNTLY